MAADNLPLRDEKAGHGKLPETFAKVRILPKMYVKQKHKQTKKKHNKSNKLKQFFPTSKPYVPKWLMLTFRVYNTSHATHHTTISISLYLFLPRIFSLSFINPKHKQKHKQTHALYQQLHTHSTPPTEKNTKSHTHTLTPTLNPDTHTHIRASSYRC